MDDRTTAPVEVGERYSVEIEDLGREGDGVARIGSFVIFVPGVDLGERVDIRIEEVGGNHATATVVDDDKLGGREPNGDDESGGRETDSGGKSGSRESGSEPRRQT